LRIDIADRRSLSAATPLMVRGGQGDLRRVCGNSGDSHDSIPMNAQWNLDFYG
jgi:hypothetical protein